MLNYEQKYQEYINLFNNRLEFALNKLSCDAPIIADAMRYAVSNGGKRIRPVLMLATANLLGVQYDEIIDYAVSLEFIHTYSLIHDDLPCMDNDDYRRGKLSTHKKYGEAMGVLAGDALLNYAIENVFNKRQLAKCDFDAIKCLFELSGYKGMIAGQVLDIENEKSNLPDYDTLYNIYVNKTGKLLTAPLLIPSIFANNRFYDKLKELGFLLGLIFQITDDILDVEGTVESIGKTPNKDKEANKLTAVKLWGLEKTKEENGKLYLKAKNIIESIPNSSFLSAFLDKIYNRKS